MNAQTIIDQVDQVWCPNTQSLETKVALLNQFQNQLYRKLDAVESQAIVALTQNTASYTLPTGVQADRIRHVVQRDGSANETELTCAKFVTGDVPDGYYTIVTGTSLKIAAPGTTGGTVASIAVTAGGGSFTSAPTVSVTGGGGSGCTATATINDDGEVDAVTVDEPGTGFTSVPTIGFSGGGGTSAAATATLGNIMVITHASIPTALTTATLTSSPWGPADYHQFYVWRLSEFMAKANRDVVLANNFKADGDEVLRDLLRDYSTSPDSGFQVFPVW